MIFNYYELLLFILHNQVYDEDIQLQTQQLATLLNRQHNLWDMLQTDLICQHLSFVCF